MSVVVDIDDERTWPDAVDALVTDYAARHRGRTEYTSDLDITWDDEPQMDFALTGHHLLVYHCTRLLPHEDDMIRSQGLRLLTPDLLRERIDAANQHGHVLDDEAALFHQSHVFASREHRNRENGADVIVGVWPFYDMPGGVNPLRSIWGGEAMYMSSRSIDETRLEQLGRPSIVVAHLLYDPPDRIASYSRTLLRAFVGKRLELVQPGTQLKLRTPLLPEEIADIWHPGDANYDRFPRLWQR